MSPQEYREACEYLSWTWAGAETARQLGVSRSQTYNYAKGLRPVPATVALLLEARVALMGKLSAEWVAHNAKRRERGEVL